MYFKFIYLLNFSTNDAYICQQFQLILLLEHNIVSFHFISLQQFQITEQWQYHHSSSPAFFMSKIEWQFSSFFRLHSTTQTLTPMNTRTLTLPL